MAQKPTTPETFWAQVERTDGCWLWHGARHYSGYGVVSYYNRQWRAHRLAWKFTYGKEPPTNLRHTCDNPLCCRPSHLLVGTPADNSADMVARDRQAKGEQITANRDTARGTRNGMHTQPGTRTKGSKHWKARLTWSNVDDMRGRYAAGQVTLDDLEREYPKVSRAQLTRILRGQAWTRLDEPPANLGKGHRRGPDGRMMKG